MRWPWVSRELYERVYVSDEEWQDAYDKLQADANTRYDALLAKYHALRLQGATAAEPRQPVEAKEPDAVHWAIMQRAGNNRALSGYLSGWAQTQRRDDVPDGEIIERISNWHNANDDE